MAPIYRGFRFRKSLAIRDERGWAHPDLNRGPTLYESVALPAELCWRETGRERWAERIASNFFPEGRGSTRTAGDVALQAFRLGMVVRGNPT